MNQPSPSRRLTKIILATLAICSCVAVLVHITTAPKPGGLTSPGQPHGATHSAPTTDSDAVRVTVVDPAMAPEGALEIETNVMKARVSLIGGQLTHVELKKYADAGGTGRKAVLIDSSPRRQFTLQTGLVEHDGALPDHHTKFHIASLTSGEKGRAGEVTIKADRNDITLEKRFVFRSNSYTISLEEAIRNDRASTAAPILYLQLRHDGRKPEGEGRFSGGFSGPVIYSDKGGYQKLTFAALNKGIARHVRTADNGWFAIPQHFFVTAVIPKAGTPREIYATKVAQNAYTLGNKIPLGELRPHEVRTIGTDIYAGPIDRTLLETEAPGLDLTQDYGWLTVVAEPMYTMLSIAKSLIGNWGWAIIAMTLVVRILFLPLSASTHKRMAKIKLLAPQLQALREQMGDDPAAMHKATMALYRQENISLTAGCLPLLVQMPIFLALYWVLQSSVALRGAPWVGWIHDLTQPDPYFVLPVLYAITMLLTVKLSPKPVAPTSPYIAYAFPFGLSLVFAFMPAGVAMFWIVTNIMTFAQQFYYHSKHRLSGIGKSGGSPIASAADTEDLPGQTEKSQEPMLG
ncbi:membrane protein insertase YidC [Duganella vulcania]|uniref:Membrane protein insertase YidC n=1 Tax=Duganella vulcania TaxID=2692166 RepID=A0A845GEP7_9BURK|nr:membrane protein insertase YidC [Duganella vulcania]MYM92774.1 membrane protein insertase YidC [Duganella vulcania]